jgi:hypothetical protein
MVLIVIQKCDALLLQGAKEYIDGTPTLESWEIFSHIYSGVPVLFNGSDAEALKYQTQSNLDRSRSLNRRET